MAGEYRLLRRLGEGGSGAVYEAEHPVLKRRAAVKVLHRPASAGSAALSRFLSEAKAVNQIHSRHIVDVFSFGVLADGRPFYVMDLLEGEPLDRYLKRAGRLEVATTLQILRPIAEALDLAHAAGIVHRDLKPQNVFLAREASGEIVPKLLDFGVAKLLDQSDGLTLSGTMIGTPLYMSPEQARGESVDARSDVYALGVLCYQLLTGKLPVAAEGALAIAMAHITQPPVSPSEVCAELPPALDVPLLHMLQKRADQRPNSAGAALSAVRDAAERAGCELTTGVTLRPSLDPEAPSPGAIGLSTTVVESPSRQAPASPPSAPSELAAWNEQAASLAPARPPELPIRQGEVPSRPQLRWSLLGAFVALSIAAAVYALVAANLPMREPRPPSAAEPRPAVAPNAAAAPVQPAPAPASAALPPPAAFPPPAPASPAPSPTTLPPSGPAQARPAAARAPHTPAPPTVRTHAGPGARTRQRETIPSDLENPF